MEPLLDVRPLLYESEFRIPGGLIVERQARAVAAINAFGEIQRPPVNMITIDPVAVHNVSGRNLLRVPEADRSTENIMGYSEARLFLATKDMEPDVVRYNSRRWRVNSVQDYAVQGGVYLWTAALIEEGAS